MRAFSHKYMAAVQSFYLADFQIGSWTHKAHTKKEANMYITWICRKSASRFSRGTVLNTLKQSRINIMRGKKDATTFPASFFPLIIFNLNMYIFSLSVNNSDFQPVISSRLPALLLGRRYCHNTSTTCSYDTSCSLLIKEPFNVGLWGYLNTKNVEIVMRIRNKARKDYNGLQMPNL